MTGIWFLRAISGRGLRAVTVVADWVGLGVEWFGMLIIYLATSKV
jgi:hypothetical protein